MTFDQLRDNAAQSAWGGILPGRPAPYFLNNGEGEHSKIFDILVTVLVSKYETDGQFGVFTTLEPQGTLVIPHVHSDVHEVFFIIEGKVRVFVQHPDGRQEDRLLLPGDIGYVPAGATHSYRSEGERNKILGITSAGFERFFQSFGTFTDQTDLPIDEPFVPSEEQTMQAFAEYKNTPLFDYKWDKA